MNSDEIMYRICSESKKKYLQLLESTKGNPEYTLHTSENVFKFTYLPLKVWALQVIKKIPNQKSVPYDTLINLIFHDGYSLSELFEVLKKFGTSYISTLINGLEGNIGDKDALLNSIIDNDYQEFRNIARSDRINFLALENLVRIGYEGGVDIMSESGYDDEKFQAEILRRIDIPENFAEIEDEYYHKRNITFRLFDSLEIAFDDQYGSKTPCVVYYKNIISEARETFPSLEDYKEKKDEWRLSYLFYIYYLCILIPSVLLGCYQHEVMAKFMSRFAWHPCVLPYLLRWTEFPVNFLIDSAKEQEDSSNDELYYDCDEYFVNIKPEFLEDEKKYGRLIFLLPCVNIFLYDKLYILNYRLSGKDRPKKERLSTDIFFKESGPYVYYFIKGIVYDNPDKPQDVYEKMKRFFTTTDWPENEEDMEEPCQVWKDALAEIAPDIFGNDNQYKLPKQKSPEHKPGILNDMPPRLFEAEIAKISVIFAPRVHAEQIYYPKENTKLPLEWSGDWNKLSYMIRILYCGMVQKDKIVTNGIVKSSVWEIMKADFIKEGKHPSSLKTKSWNDLQKTYGFNLDYKLIPILEKAGRVIR